jgi:S1-C subfamily serine protease
VNSAQWHRRGGSIDAGAGVLARVAAFVAFVAALFVCFATAAQATDISDTIARVKPSVVAVGTFERTRSPQFQFRGTGFAVGDGTIIVTNAHVLPEALDDANGEVVAILLPGPGNDVSQGRLAKRIAVDASSDLALLKIDGAPLPPLKLRDSSTVREGQYVLMTGFPIGAVLGPFPATHRGMISSITPIAIPQGNAAELKSAVVRRLTSGSFKVFQLDATAYPGNSGSPIYDPDTGEVLGIVNMVLVKGTKEAALTHPSGITYAVPSSHLEALLKSAAVVK